MDDRKSSGAASDLETRDWIEKKIKELNENIEKRIHEDREFVKSTLGLAAKICGACILLIVSTFGFFGYNSISVIDEKISKGVSEKIKEKSEEFSKKYEDSIQGLTDQALVTAYNIQAAAPPKDRSERREMLPAHLQRFVEILSDPKSNDKVLNPIYDLLSNPELDGRSKLVDNRLSEMVAASGPYSWLKEDPGRHAKIIDLMRDRIEPNQRQSFLDPSKVRTYLSAQVAPIVRESAILYAEAARDKDALPPLLAMLGDKAGSAPEELLFAILSLEPANNRMREWIAALTAEKPDESRGADYYDRIIRPARVAARLIKSAAKQSAIWREIDSEILAFATSSVSLILVNGGTIEFDRNRFPRASIQGEYRLLIGFPRSRGLYVVAPDLLLNEGGAVASKLCRDLYTANGVGGFANLLRSSKRLSSFQISHGIRIRIEPDKHADVNVDGQQFKVTQPLLLRPRQNAEQTQTLLTASWKTSEGVTKVGTLSGIHDPEFVCSFYIEKGDEDM